MASREQARENKEAVRSELTSRGFCVVSVGLIKTDDSNWTVEAGIIPSNEAPEDIDVNGMIVNVRQQSKPRFLTAKP